MKTGIELIAEERNEQIEKHGRTVEHDVKINTDQQLKDGAVKLLLTALQNICPNGWSLKIWFRMVNKSYKERLIIAGALLAAEIDRINYLENSLKGKL